jgi:hypothetical protein
MRKMKTMKTLKNIGLVICSNSGKIFSLASLSSMMGYTLKKVLIESGASENSFRKNYPDVEIVKDKNSFMQDSSLDLIVVAAPANKYTGLIGEVLKSGKPVRVVSRV